MATYLLDVEGGNDGPPDIANPGRNVAPTGGAVIDTTRTKFGSYGLNLVAGTSAASLFMVPGTGCHFGAGQFTVEAWVWFNTHSATAQEVICGTYAASSNLGFDLTMSTAGQLVFAYSTTGADNLSVGAAYTPSLGQWIHIAADRDASNVLRVYANGAVVASATVAAAIFASTRDLYVGNDGNLSRRFPGYIGGLRITKGVARYAGAFTPPTAAFPESLAGDASFASVTCLLSFNSNADGLTFANRWRTFIYGANAARVAGGDTVRVMASPEPTLVGNATWNQNSKTITLAASVTQMISDCEVAWTASTNVTPNTSASTFKEGVRAVMLSPVSAFTTGKLGYRATGTLDLSGYQQVAFWFRSSALGIPAGQLTLRLCSDTTGDVAVHTIPIPAQPVTGQFFPVVVDLGINLSSAIGSVALYAESDPGVTSFFLDNIIACKAASSPDALTLASLIGPASNLCWAASQSYAVGDLRKPTQPSRNGYRYQVSAQSGATGATEPVWPEEIGVSVTDGGVTWVCEGVEDSWYQIQSINGTTVKIDTLGALTAGNAGRGYAGATATVPTYRRETIKLAQATSNSTLHNQIVASGALGAPLVFSGGWSRTDMAAMTGETWFDGQNCVGRIFSAQVNYIQLNNLSGVRAGYGLSEPGIGILVRNCHFAGMMSYVVFWSGSTPDISFVGVALINNSDTFNMNNPGTVRLRRVRLENNLGAGFPSPAISYIVSIEVDVGSARNNGSWGMDLQTRVPVRVSNVIFGNNTSGAVQASDGQRFYNCLFPESVEFYNPYTRRDQYVYSDRHDQVEGSYLLTTDGGSITSATDQRHSATGISWKFRPTATIRAIDYPLCLSVAKVACEAGVALSLQIWVRRSHANIKGCLKVAGGQIAGVPVDVSVLCEPTINTWVLSDTLTVTPTVSGVIDVTFEAWDGVGTTNNLWIDDLVIS